MNIQDFKETGKAAESTRHIKGLMKKIVYGEIKKRNGNAKILDSGCGAGSDIIEIKEGNPDVLAYGEDSHIKSHKLSHEGVTFIKADIEKTAEGNFDIILSSEVLHCLKGRDIEGYLDRLGKRLKPGGLLVITTFNRDYAWKRVFRLFVKGDSWYHQTHRLFTPAELRRLLEKKGFTVEKVVGGRFLHGSHSINRIDFLPKGLTCVRHNYLVAARKT